MRVLFYILVGGLASTALFELASLLHFLYIIVSIGLSK